MLYHSLCVSIHQPYLFIRFYSFLLQLFKKKMCMLDIKLHISIFLYFVAITRTSTPRLYAFFIQLFHFSHFYRTTKTHTIKMKKKNSVHPRCLSRAVNLLKEMYLYTLYIKVYNTKSIHCFQQPVRLSIKYFLHCGNKLMGVWLHHICR